VFTAKGCYFTSINSTRDAHFNPHQCKCLKIISAEGEKFDSSRLGQFLKEKENWLEMCNMLRRFPYKKRIFLKAQ
jgi:hypothetical protein